MGRQFNDRGRGGGRGGGGRGRGGGFNRGPADFGPPSYVIPYGTYLHKSESNLVVKCTDMSRFPKFNRGIYLENKSKIGTVDQIFGPLNSFYFSVKPVEGVNASNFKEGQILYINPQDLLSTDKFTRPQAPRSRGPPGQGGPPKFNRPINKDQRGGFGGNNRVRGGFGGPSRGRGGFRGRGH